jgi:hypothetical protein
LITLNWFAEAWITMKKMSLVPMTGLMLVVILLCAAITGCTTSQAPTTPPATAQKLSTLDPSQMILEPSDVPANFTLMGTYERNTTNMNAWALSKGWKKGYGTYYETTGPDARGLSQVISIYPLENITLIVPDTVQGTKNWSVEDANVTVEELPVPGIGDVSRALQISEKGDPINMYMITFVKYDVYEEMYVNGTARDYETFLQTAKKAAAKIK